MKILVTMCVAEHSAQLHKIFNEENVTAFWETDARGFNLSGKKEHRIDNWFADQKRPINSIINFVWVTEVQARVILLRMNQCNAKSENTEAAFAFTLEPEDFLAKGKLSF